MKKDFPRVGRPEKRFSKGWNFVAAGLLALAGCRSLDDQVERQVGRTAGPVGPLAAQARSEVERARQAETNTVAHLELDLDTALRTAAQYSRELQGAREALYLDTLSLFGTRRDFGLTFEGSVAYILNQRPDGDTARASGQLVVQRILPTGGRIGLAGQVEQNRREPEGGETTTGYQSGGRVRLDQPLLAGAGYEASHAPLIQAERDYVYALRDFVVQRQDLALRVMREYYGLLQARRVLENTRLNVQQVVFLRQRSEALFRVSRAPAIDVLRSQQEELSAVNRLQAGEESFAIQVSRLLVFLGLPATGTASIGDTVPEVKPLDLAEADSIALGLARRLDLLNTTDRIADAERNLRLARQARRPELSVYGEASLDAPEAESLGDQEYASSQSAGVELELPLDRRDERDAARRAAIALAAARRNGQEKLDSVRLEIASSFSDLRSLRTTVDLEARNIEVAGKRARNASLRFRNGELSNRDVLEAENDLLNARNAWAQARIDYELQRMQLMRNLGLLDVAEDGTLVELPSPAGAVAPDAPAALPNFEVIE